ncbi:hypothetical protein [Nocardioides sp.]|uniref:hypothetical protein n=1 Tax=Nocardioides sp. TaxID=35761 RepID=UPI002ED6A713
MGVAKVASACAITALAAAGLVAVNTPADAAETTPLRLDFVSAAADGTIVDTFTNGGSAAFTIDVAARDGGVVRVSTQGASQSVDFPDYDGSAPAARAAIRVRNPGANDEMSPGGGRFEFGADFRLDQVSQGGTSIDGGNTLLERGLGSSPSQFRLEVTDGRVGCRIKGDQGARLVRSSVTIVPLQWYGARCARDGDTVRVSVTTYHADGSTSTVISSGQKATGDLAFPRATPLAIGARLKADGALVPGATDQLNGRVDNVFLTLDGSADPPDPPDPPADGITLAAAGDLCGQCGVTANRVSAIDPDVVVTVGDHAYNNGLLSEFRQKYGGGTVPETRWGRPSIKNITLPGYGNHDCVDYPRSTGATKQGCDGAVAYFGPDSDFGTDIAGTAGSYSTVVGDWLVVHLNSAGDQGSGVATAGEVAEQNAGLRDVLTADAHRCEVVVWHHPRYSSGDNSPFPFVDPWFRTAHGLGVDVVLSAHDRGYERFAPLDANGRPVASGLRQFVVGTGGASLHDFPRVDPGSQAQVESHGVLTMQLRATGYDWAFRNAGTGAVQDSGSSSCRS